MESAGDIALSVSETGAYVLTDGDTEITVLDGGAEVGPLSHDGLNAIHAEEDELKRLEEREQELQAEFAAAEAEHPCRSDRHQVTYSPDQMPEIRQLPPVLVAEVITLLPRNFSPSHLENFQSASHSSTPR